MLQQSRLQPTGTLFHSTLCPQGEILALQWLRPSVPQTSTTRRPSAHSGGKCTRRLLDFCSDWRAVTLHLSTTGTQTGPNRSTVMQWSMRIPTTDWCESWKRRCPVWKTSSLPRAWPRAWPRARPRSWTVRVHSSFSQSPSVGTWIQMYPQSTPGRRRLTGRLLAQDGGWASSKYWDFYWN